MEERKSTNITWHFGFVTKEDREKLNGHKGVVIWFTGLPSSGKSTLAHALEYALYQRGCHTFVLDGDNIRHGLNKDLGFSPQDRQENIRRIGEVAALFCQAGIITLTAFISPYRADRQKARLIAGTENFIEVYVKCPVEICEQRDPKGLYAKARTGQIAEFTGITAPYEEPEAPEITVDTSVASVELITQQILHYLEERGFIS